VSHQCLAHLCYLDVGICQFSFCHLVWELPYFRIFLLLLEPAHFHILFWVSGSYSHCFSWLILRLLWEESRGVALLMSAGGRFSTKLPLEWKMGGHSLLVAVRLKIPVPYLAFSDFNEVGVLGCPVTSFHVWNFSLSTQPLVVWLEVRATDFFPSLWCLAGVE
jgi:hypothetical protein